MKLNNKGFTLVEVLAVVAILAILSGVAISAVTKYQEKARQEAYEAMHSTAYAAAQNYIQARSSVIPTASDTPSYKEIKIETLLDEGFMKDFKDPAQDSTDCAKQGSYVRITKQEGSGSKLSSYTYVVHIECSQYSDTKTFNS